MLDKHEREERRSLIFSIVCTICGIFLLSMVLAAHFDLLVIKTSTYDEWVIKLSDAETKIEWLEYQLENPDEITNWDDIPIQDIEEEIIP